MRLNFNNEYQWRRTRSLKKYFLIADLRKLPSCIEEIFVQKHVKTNE